MSNVQDLLKEVLAQPSGERQELLIQLIRHERLGKMEWQQLIKAGRAPSTLEYRAIAPIFKTAGKDGQPRPFDISKKGTDVMKDIDLSLSDTPLSSNALSQIEWCGYRVWSRTHLEARLGSMETIGEAQFATGVHHVITSALLLTGSLINIQAERPIAAVETVGVRAGRVDFALTTGQGACIPAFVEVKSNKGMESFEEVLGQIMAEAVGLFARNRLNGIIIPEVWALLVYPEGSRVFHVSKDLVICIKAEAPSPLARLPYDRDQFCRVLFGILLQCARTGLKCIIQKSQARSNRGITTEEFPTPSWHPDSGFEELAAAESSSAEKVTLSQSEFAQIRVELAEEVIKDGSGALKRFREDLEAVSDPKRPKKSRLSLDGYDNALKCFDEPGAPETIFADAVKALPDEALGTRPILRDPENEGTT